MACKKIPRTCKRCGKDFLAFGQSVKAGKGLYCSNSCSTKSRTPAIERFWAKVVKTDYCWIWQQAHHKDPYGAFMVNRKTVRAHRFSYELHHGPIPEGLVVRHKCDNPPCVNPDHLEVGTMADNGRDMMERNRYHYMRGSEHPRTRLTEQDVLSIRKRCVKGGPTQGQLAAEYGVSRSTIGAIKRRQNWHHLD